MHPALSAMTAAALQTERLAEAHRARTMAIDGADWPATRPPHRARSTLAERIRRRLE